MAINDPSAPPLLILSQQDQMTYLPIQVNHRMVNHPRRTESRRAHRGLDLGQQRPVTWPADLNLHQTRSARFPSR